MTTEDPGFSRRTILRTAAGVVVATAAGTACGMATSTFASAAVSRRALLHLTPTTGWACDPQRPYYLGGQLQLPRLQAAQTAGPGGWRLATSTDEVSFSDVGDTIPLVGDTPAWSGSAVVDTDNTAGLGAGAVVALVTHVPHGDLTRQAQYLHWSTLARPSISTGQRMAGAAFRCSPNQSFRTRMLIMHLRMRRSIMPGGSVTRRLSETRCAANGCASSVGVSISHSTSPLTYTTGGGPPTSTTSHLGLPISEAWSALTYSTSLPMTEPATGSSAPQWTDGELDRSAPTRTG